MNPAVTLAMCSVGKLPWRKLFHYLAAQYLGAFFGAVVTFLVYREAINNAFNGQLAVEGVNATAGIFGEVPNVPKFPGKLTNFDVLGMF